MKEYTFLNIEMLLLQWQQKLRDFLGHGLQTLCDLIQATKYFLS